VADEELRLGTDVVVVVVLEAEEEAVPVLPVVSVFEGSDVVVELRPAPLLATDVDDEDVGSAEALALAPGRSWATTAPMITVVPVLARIAPRVSVRSRARALSLSVGVVGWDRSGM
jgi:hypothetical protein